MLDELTLYTITSLLLLAPWPFIWRRRRLTTLRVVVLLFLLDSALTIEAAYYGSIVFIGLLHVITIPALLGLLYFDLINQNRTTFTCFVCSKPIKDQEKMESVSRTVAGERMNVSVHSACIADGRREKKAFSSRIFKRGIPN